MLRVRVVRGREAALEAAMCQLHAGAFPGFFLTRLGPRFLAILYRAFMTEEGGLCVLAEDDDGVLGVAAGCEEPSRFFRRLLRTRGVAFALAAVPAVAARPWVFAWRCIGALRYRGESPRGLDGAGLLSSLAVAPRAQGAGVGKALVTAFLDEARTRGLRSVYLTTDRDGNERTNRFYEKCGFKCIGEIRRAEGRVMRVWLREFKDTREEVQPV